MKLFIKKSPDIQISNQIEVDLGNGFESYETENLITNGLELSDDTDFSKIKVRHNNKILENIEIMKKLEIKNVPVGLSKSTVFPNCYFFGDYVIPEGVTSIGYGVFSTCTNLTSIEIPSSVTSIGDSAFNGCTNLTSIEIPSSVTSIGYGVFSNCTNLTSIEIPDGVTSIGGSAFDGCTNLTSIEIPSSVTSIGYGVFSNCTNLTSIEIPDGVTSIGINALYNCTSLKTINYTGTEEQWNSISKGSGWNTNVPSDCQIVFNYVG